MTDNRAKMSGKAVPLRRLIPNLITLLGLCAGLSAIRMAIEGRFELAIAAIVIAGLFDALDGRMARLLKANSKFGAELDSLADFVNFGVAPAITLYLWGLSSAPSVGWIAALLFALSAALRLARFNVAANEETAAKPSWQKLFFTGAPTPAGAILLLFPLYLEGLGVPKGLFPAPVLIAYALILAAFMISRVPTYSGKFEHFKIERNHAGPVIVAGVALIMLLATYPYLTLALATVAYAASVPFAIRAYAIFEAEERLEAPSMNAPQARLSVVEGAGSPGALKNPPGA